MLLYPVDQKVVIRPLFLIRQLLQHMPALACSLPINSLNTLINPSASALINYFADFFALQTASKEEKFSLNRAPNFISMAHSSIKQINAEINFSFFHLPSSSIWLFFLLSSYFFLLIKFQKLFRFSSVQQNEDGNFFFALPPYLTIKRKHLIFPQKKTTK